MLGVQAERMDVGRDSPAVPGDGDGPGGHGAAGEHGDAGTSSATRVGGEDGGHPGAGASDSATVPDSAGRHRAVGAAVADRLPLPLRALTEGLPSSVRGGEAGLQRLHAVVIGVVILVGLVVALVSSGLGSPDVTPVDAVPSSTTLETGTPVPVSAGAESADDLPDNAAANAAAKAPDQPPGTVVVHVAGKVADPGIVELPAGSRVIDAVEAAGGADDGVDLAALNLARVLVDGEQVAVGIEPVADPVRTGDAAEQVVNLNTATPAELESLPGIGPALAANIVAWRDEHGRFTVIDELQEVNGIGPAKLAALADRVTL